MKQIKITASIGKAIDALSRLINGEISTHEKPSWGWEDVKFIISSPIKRENELAEEDGGHGRSVMNQSGNCRLTREVSFWMTNEFHLATIHLCQDSFMGNPDKWYISDIKTDINPQYGRRG